MLNYNDFIVDQLKDPKEAALYLKVATEEYAKDLNYEALLIAINHVAQARGGLTTLSKNTQLSRTNLYKALSSKGNPRLNTIEVILGSMGFRFSIEPLKSNHNNMTTRSGRSRKLTKLQGASDDATIKPLSVKNGVFGLHSGKTRKLSKLKKPANV